MVQLITRDTYSGEGDKVHAHFTEITVEVSKSLVGDKNTFYSPVELSGETKTSAYTTHDLCDKLELC